MMDKRNRSIRRVQDIAIVLLACSALFLAGSLPLFGELSDESLIQLARERMKGEGTPVESPVQPLYDLAAPVRVVFTNRYASFCADALTTADEPFEAVGAPLGEAIGSAVAMTRISEQIMLERLSGEGFFFDFIVPLPLDLLGQILGVAAPETGLEAVRQVFLSPAEGDDAALYLRDVALGWCRFETAVRSAGLTEYLSSLDGGGGMLACLAGGEYAALSPYSLIPEQTDGRFVAAASSDVGESVLSSFLRHAEFNAHTDNRFVESSGTVIVREASSTLHLYPDGTVDYQGESAKEGSLYFVPSALPGEPTRIEAASAAYRLAAALLREPLGDAALYVSGVSREDGAWVVRFDLLLSGTPVRFSDGSHAAAVTVSGDSITAFTMKLRRYTLTDTPAELLPARQAAGIVRRRPGAELSVVYCDAGGDSVSPAWITD